jgi:hypothetical protein
LTEIFRFNGLDQLSRLAARFLLAYLLSAAAVVAQSSPSAQPAAALKRIGRSEVPAPRPFLDNEISSHDMGRILRAFHEVTYSRNWNQSEIVSTLRAFLHDSDPFLRLNAAKGLLTIGEEQEGVLEGLVAMGQPTMGIGRDIRLDAAAILAQYRITASAGVVYALYLQTNDGDLIDPLVRLKSDEAATVVASRGYFSEPFSVATYGEASTLTLAPKIAATFAKTKKPDLKLASAWALAKMTGNIEATSYLVVTASLAATADQPSLAGSLGSKGVTVRDAVKFLGALRAPSSKAVLEDALNSSDKEIVCIAAVNLVFNQGGSAKVNELVEEELKVGAPRLGTELTLNLAKQLNDPMVDAAGRIFDRRDGNGIWKLYMVERKRWPIYNWIDDFVIELNN